MKHKTGSRGILVLTAVAAIALGMPGYGWADTYILTNEYFEFSEDYYGFTWEPVEAHTSFIPYTSVGAGVNFTYGKYLEEDVFRGGATLYAGFSLPLGIMSFSADAIAEVGYNSQKHFLDSNGFGLSPGLDLGLSIAGFKLRYRGLWISSERTIHSVGLSISDRFFSDGTLFTILGMVFAALGVACIGYGTVIAQDNPDNGGYVAGIGGGACGFGVILAFSMNLLE